MRKFVVPLFHKSRRLFSTLSYDYEVAIIGGGIVGLATAREMLHRFPQKKVVVLEKENEIGLHQTGHNSGVIHSGIYYATGSLRSTLCIEGRVKMYKYCKENNIPHEKCGKLIVAVKEEELPLLEKLYEKGLQNKIEGIKLVNSEDITKLEPHLKGLKAIFSPQTGIVDFSKVAKKFGEELISRGGEVKYNFQVAKIEKCQSNEHVGVEILSSNQLRVKVKYLISCAGMYSDSIAHMTGSNKYPIIVPVRGEWRLLKHQYRHLVKGLIYPVPDPRYPWLGVHFTKKMDEENSILIGPNAVLATSRNGYSITDVNLGDLKDYVLDQFVVKLSIDLFSAFRKFAFKNLRTGIGEISRSLSSYLYSRELKDYIPEITPSHLQDEKRSGVRALALSENGTLIDDFVIEAGKDWDSIIHVRNAPSPAATSSMAIARKVIDLAEKQFKFTT